ncbi:MAG: 23S rRNA (pseudouridine(1915)-N(3))-methyltransferase RlmH [Rikenellaceae bacterium]
MNIELVAIGKTDSKEIAALIDDYTRRINFYNKFSITVLPDVKRGKGFSEQVQKRAESELFLRYFQPSDYVVLLDERGSEYSSMEFSSWLQKRMNSGLKRLCFVIGGPYGFSPEVYERANSKISLSRMTFSHQMIRALFAEQLYRGYTIIAGEPYHHE